MVVDDESIAACAHYNNKDDDKKLTNDDSVGIRGNTKRFGRGERHETKQRRLYIYHRAAPSLSLCTARPWIKPVQFSHLNKPLWLLSVVRRHPP